MPTASPIACIAAAFLIAGSAAAQPTPTPADAEQAAVDLIRAIQARDWPALSAFVDPQATADLAASFPATPADAEMEFRAQMAEVHVDADRLMTAAPGELLDSDLRVLARVYRWTRALSAGGPPTGQDVMARVLALIVRCDPESPAAAFDAVQYDPVRADDQGGGAVTVVGRVAATVDGESREALVVTPLRWRGGHWTVDGAAPESPGAETNPVVALLTAGTLDLTYATLMALQTAEDGTVPGCGDE